MFTYAGSSSETTRIDLEQNGYVILPQATRECQTLLDNQMSKLNLPRTQNERLKPDQNQQTVVII